MNSWLNELERQLASSGAAHLRRALVATEIHGPYLVRGGRRLVNLAGNDYLGLAQHPRLCQAAGDAIAAHGVGAGASRLVVGHGPLHEAVETRFAAFKHAEAALLCPTGYLANLAVLTSLAGPGDLVCCDKLSHASLLDAAAASGATLRVFPHLNYGKLRRMLQRDREGKLDRSGHRGSPAGPRRRRFIVTDSVFSMDGDVADLPALCDLAEEFEAVLIVDEAHATGVLGRGGAGLCEWQGVTGSVDVVVSTASKALGSLGGLVTARRVVIDTLVNRARPFIYTTAVPPAQAAAIAAALDVIRDEPQRRRRLLDLSARLRREVAGLAWLTPALPPSAGEAATGPRPPEAPNAAAERDSAIAPSTSAASADPAAPPTPIIPLVVGSAEAALALSAHLESHGLFAPAIRPPTVGPGAARVRVSLRADLEDAHLDRLLEALRCWRGTGGATILAPRPGPGAGPGPGAEVS